MRIRTFKMRWMPEVDVREALAPVLGAAERARLAPNGVVREAVLHHIRLCPSRWDAAE